MLTRSRIQRGEGKLEEYNPKIGKRRTNPPSQMEGKGGEEGSEDESIQKTLQNLETIVQVLVQEREDKMRRCATCEDKGKRPGGDPEPPKTPPSPSSPSSTHSESSSLFKSSHKPKIKLDVKFDLPKYCGELNAEKLDDWIQQVEVYCRVQNLLDDADRIQLATLRLGGTTLTWWESRIRDGSSQHGKINLTWQGKGQSVQDYTHEFRKKAIALNVPLYTQDMLLKYIGGLHSYLRHSILVLNPNNLDEVGVQATHLESRGKGSFIDKFDKNPSKSENKSQNKGKGKKTAIVKKEGEKPTCSHCKKEGHDDSRCWKLHPKKRPKRYGGNKDKQKTAAIVQQDLGSDSGDETKIVATRIQGKEKGRSLSSATSSSNISASTSKDSTPKNDKQRNELFHIRVVIKHTKVDTLFDTGSQVNLIYEEIVKKLNLTTTPHPKPYPLGWVCNDAQLQVTKQCKIRFAITANFVDEVEADVVPLDICGLVLGSPYLYDR
ncbi:uncharacterized protein LOC131054430 [Cryptomeria japonica]|uniref:uncharacterized protein LOC131054430 n=1 Tax=Cryptomeria japonica TaxID=3369 RepID=UPI0027DA28FE|nr:uncharacterized protein LOC131054430 [Cryptomeria japonica]